MTEFVLFAMAQPQGGEAANPLSLLFPFIGMLAIFYLLLIRPQQKRAKETAKMLDALKKGDRVLTNAGIYGTVAGIKDDVIVLTVAENVKMEFAKSAVAGVPGAGGGGKADDKNDKNGKGKK